MGGRSAGWSFAIPSWGKVLPEEGGLDGRGARVPARTGGRGGPPH